MNLLTFPYVLIIPERFNYFPDAQFRQADSETGNHCQLTKFHVRSGLMQTATIEEKPGNQAVSDRFRAGLTYWERIKDDHKID